MEKFIFIHFVINADNTAITLLPLMSQIKQCPSVCIKINKLSSAWGLLSGVTVKRLSVCWNSNHTNNHSLVWGHFPFCFPSKYTWWKCVGVLDTPRAFFIWERYVLMEASCFIISLAFTEGALKNSLRMWHQWHVADVDHDL